MTRTPPIHGRESRAAAPRITARFPALSRSDFRFWATQAMGRGGDGGHTDSSMNICRCGFGLWTGLSGRPFERMRLQKTLGGVILERLLIPHVGAQPIERLVP